MAGLHRNRAPACAVSWSVASPFRQGEAPMIDGQGAQPVAEDRTYRALAWIGVAIQAAALVAVLVVERFGGVPSLASFLVLSVAFLLLPDRLPGLLTFLVIVAAVVNAAGWAFDLYQKFAP